MTYQTDALRTEHIAKLKVRFPDKFTQAQAVDRDLGAERAALEATP